MRMGIGLGVGINRSNYAQGIFNAYSARVVADGGVVESGSCVDAVSSLLQSASLLLIPSGYKGGKLYAEIPTNGNGDLTWTRGSDAFRTNASGVIQRMPWNLLSYSEDFGNIYWSKDAGVTVDTNVDLAPNGTTTADRLNLSTNGAVYRSGLSFGTGSFTLSVWLKGEGANIGKQVLLEFTNGNSTVTLTGDWQRFTTTGTNVINVAIKRATSGQASAVLAWGIQVVEGTTAQTYLPTTDRLNFPRLSYMYGSCPSALLEPQRTNLVLRSEEFDNASWSKNNATVTANSTTSPDGSSNADSLIENTALTQHFTSQQLTKSASSITYAFSVYYKNASGTRNIGVAVTNGTSSGKVAIFTSSGTITATDVTIGTGLGFSMTSSSVTNVGNGWYRASVIVSTDTATRVDTVVYLTNSTTNVLAYTGDGTSAYFIYGAQLEVGAYPTTYIPTTSATATRVADSFSRSNIYTNGLISASGGTWFVELRNNVAYTRDSIGGVWIGDNTTSGTLGNTLVMRNGGPDRLTIGKTISGTFTSLYTTTTNTTKIAIKWNGTTADIFANGTKVVSATAFTPTIMENLVGNATDVPKFIQQMALFPTPISDTDCTTLTT